MEKHCKNCNKIFNKKINTSIKSWAKSKYCSINCRKIGESKIISERLTQQNKSRIGTMRFNGIAYTKEWCKQNPEKVQRFKEERKLKIKLLRSEKLKILAEQRKLLNPKVLKTDEYKKLWQKEYRKRNQTYFQQFSQTDNSKYKQYISSAKRRNLEFNLTREEFIKIFHSKCIYCGDEESRGIDRVDNTTGYILNNCEPCCKICNKMKIHYSKEYFINHCKKIANQ